MTIHHEPIIARHCMEPLPDVNTSNLLKSNLIEQFDQINIMVVKIRRYIDENSNQGHSLEELERENDRLIEIIEELRWFV